MTHQNISWQTKEDHKIILLIADCWLGVKDACRFAARMLHDDRTAIILLNTFQRPAENSGMRQSITPMQILMNTKYFKPQWNRCRTGTETMLNKIFNHI